MRKLWESGKSHIERERESERAREREREPFFPALEVFQRASLPFPGKTLAKVQRLFGGPTGVPARIFFHASPFYSSLKLHSKFQKLRVLRTSFTKNELKLKGYISCFTAGLTQLVRDCCFPLPPSTKIFRSWWTFSKVHQKSWFFRKLEPRVLEESAAGIFHSVTIF